jgi:MFS family permease
MPYSAALLARFFTGMSFAGIYPCGVKIVCSHFRPLERDAGATSELSRAFAVSALVGGLIVGSALPNLIRAAVADGAGLTVALVLSYTSVACLCGGVVVVSCVPDGPFLVPPRPLNCSAIATLCGNRPRFSLLTVAYCAHNWELYGFWTSVAPFVSSLIMHRSTTHAAGWAASVNGTATNSTAEDLALRTAWTAEKLEADRIASMVAFAAMAAGAIGSIAGGGFASRFGSARTILYTNVATLACCMLCPLLWYPACPFALAVVLLIVWGLLVTPDSAQLTTLITQACEPHLLGVAVTMQLAVGFACTIPPMFIVPWLSTDIGPHWAMASLLVGPAICCCILVADRADTGQ